MKLKIILFATALALGSVNQGFSGDLINKPEKTTDAIRSQQLVNRLQEIKAMDNREMSRAEKVSLRKEVRNIEREMNRRRGRGIYLSGAAVVIIILLIILL